MSNEVTFYIALPDKRELPDGDVVNVLIKWSPPSGRNATHASQFWSEHKVTVKAKKVVPVGKPYEEHSTLYRFRRRSVYISR